MSQYIRAVAKVAAVFSIAFISGRVYEAKARMPEESKNIMSAYQAGKRECKP